MSLTPLVVSSMTRCVGGSLATRLESFHFSPSLSLNTYYVEGVSVTHGSPRQHIWTFATGVDEQTRYSYGICPCVTRSIAGSRIPSFVGQNYF